MNFILEGGPLFMVPLLILLIVIVILFVKGLKDNLEKTHKLINALALFSFVFGVLGFVIGLLGALEIISADSGKISSEMMAGGLKVSLLSPTFGMVIFLLGKLFSMILIGIKK
ncbi:MotA/TolQ/ExbB proton channel family protein [Polaribacter litorisediminis]|uniref:MotA/TolQ/ExbB proton channel family protein n=1 Tax=Polaribacter litorisediminis TaxID=1908341 RepID=UPI001CBE74E5|nr:MotA/TolQ/ExbB proton channel family protein [Polaribacter litorisediminis]UAM98716.1 MotA/TolQ/ExbB proton channel family protein [Polaribacter litorisediminis]